MQLVSGKVTSFFSEEKNQKTFILFGAGERPRRLDCRGRM
jgi:hypothetical protein